ncbi:MAG TPA: hypothetical protein VM536_14505 [Chloroflexia bacterium]|nr:hypothetical protein [Chloroflexia bacterium]
MKTNIFSRIFGFAAVLLALVAIGGANVAHAAKSQLATSPVADQITLSGDTQELYVEPGKSYTLHYKVYNSGSNKAEVKFAAGTDAGWSASLVSTSAVVLPKGSAEFSVVVDVPASTTVSTSVLKVEAATSNSAAVSYAKLVVVRPLGN